MIDFSLSEDQRVILDLARDFAKNEIMPKAQEYDDNHTFPSDIIDKAQDLGLINLDLPEEYGGANMGPIETALIAEVLGYACPGITYAMLSTSFSTAAIYHFGTPEQKKKWLSRVCQERLLASFALTEPQSGSDIRSFKSHYVKKNGSYIINGQKAWITGTTHSDIFIVFAYPKGSQEPSKMSAFIVTADSPGLIKGKPEKKLGLKASDTAGLTLEDVEVPEDQIIGREGSAYPIVRYSLARGRTGTASIATGIQQRCVDECIEYSRTRYSGGKPIGDQPIIRQYIAGMHMATEACRMAAWRASWKMAKQTDFGYEASLAKAFATTSAEKVTLKAVQIMASAGISLEYPIAKLVNDAKILSILEGTTEIQKIAISDTLYSKGLYPYYTE